MATKPRGTPLPWDELLPDLALCAVSSVVAAFCSLVFASYLGPQSCIVIINDHVIGGTQDQFTMLVTGTIFGAIAVFCALRVWSRVAEWRREQTAGAMRIAPR